MAHNTIRTDPDAPQFEINAVTREIKNNTPAKIRLIQHDHDSEIFSFVLPRYIEDHDMLECNKVEVHFINTGSNKKLESKDFYEVKDMTVDASDEEKVRFSWYVKHPATKYAGQLKFLIRFSCVQDDGTIDYAWNTAIFSGISVSEGIYNAKAVAEEYADIFVKWEKELFKEFNNINTAHASDIALINQQLSLIGKDVGGFDGRVSTVELNNIEINNRLIAVEGDTKFLKDDMGDIQTALDSILAMQNELIGGVVS